MCREVSIRDPQISDDRNMENDNPGDYEPENAKEVIDETIDDEFRVNR